MKVNVKQGREISVTHNICRLLRVVFLINNNKKNSEGIDEVSNPRYFLNHQTSNCILLTTEFC